MIDNPELLWIIVVAIWLVIGTKSFIFWWRREFGQVPVMLAILFSIGGPLIFLVGFCMRSGTKR